MIEPASQQENKMKYKTLNSITCKYLKMPIHLQTIGGDFYLSQVNVTLLKLYIHKQLMFFVLTHCRCNSL